MKMAAILNKLRDTFVSRFIMHAHVHMYHLRAHLKGQYRLQQGIETTPNPSKSNSRVCLILMDSVLYGPDRDTLHGAGCPNSS